MAITINNTQKLEGKKYQNIFITVNVDGDDCKFTHSAPSDLSGDDLQAYVDSREDFYKKEMLRNMYEDADAYDDSLEDFEAWVSAGAKNAEVKGEDHEGKEYVITPEKVIEKKAWVDTH
jgi:hypothetical protein